MVVATSAKLIEDIKNAPDDILSRNELDKEVCIVSERRALPKLNTVTTAFSGGLHPSHVK